MRIPHLLAKQGGTYPPNKISPTASHSGTKMGNNFDAFYHRDASSSRERLYLCVFERLTKFVISSPYRPNTLQRK
jgi:hypothetical protein